MAIKMKMNQADTTKLLLSLGVPQVSLDSMKTHGVSCWVSGDSLIFKVEGGPKLSEVTLKAGVLALVKGGILKKHSLGHLTGMVTSAMQKAIDAVEYKPDVDTVEDVIDEFTDWGVQPDVSDQNTGGIVLPESGIVLPENPTKKKVPPSEVMSWDPVQLTYAKELYQPVCGTSGGSIYYVIGVRPDLKVAARAKNNKLSIRFEGDLDIYENQLSTLGMAKASDHHTSMHVDVPNLDMARRTIGAVMVGMGVEWSTGYPKVDEIWEKGQ